ncbi:MAG TPA: sarcosine oxidase subunit alpha family protein [Stellaceae bacterium]|nr:sarcosine oxidase subunit alpha family protein [Stellaceae bacterium]
MSGAWRLAEGGRIDRGRRLRFTFDGKVLEGCAGDTLASALLANGIHLVGRSLKYHRPRGILTAGAEEPNAIVAVGEGSRYTPNLRATQVELYDGLVAASQNRFPSLAVDLGAIAGFAAPLLPAGFYYKTFMWPAAAWHKLYEPAIRAMAGLGRAPTAADEARYVSRFAHCDVLVAGGGPAGLAAALAAAEAGARVILCDEQAELGGSLLAAPDEIIESMPSAAWLAGKLAALSRNARVTLLPRTTAFGYFMDNFLGLVERVTDHLAAPHPGLPRERLWQVRAGEVVLATGALERPLVFPDNDRPGIMLSRAAATYAQCYGVRPGSRAVIATVSDEAYRDALILATSGVAIAAIVDPRPVVEGKLPDAARAAGLPIMPGAAVIGTRGRLRVTAAEVAPAAGGPPQRIPCDLIAMSGGFTPNVHLFSQSRSKLEFDESCQAFVPGQAIERVRSAGACRAIFGLAAALADGYAAGEAAAHPAGFGGVGARRPAVASSGTATGWDSRGVTSHSRGPSRAKAFVDFQNDVTAGDIALATREGFRSIEHVKRYTTTGMATDQGKTSNLNALGIVSAALARPVPEIGLTTFRMPYTPTTFGTIAGFSRGDLFDPVRTTPIHPWAAEHGAVFEDVGLWKRARYFPRMGEDMDAAVARECRAVRASVGIFDGSTLGKIEVVGGDAAEFLNRMYINAWDKLAPGRCRYGVMLGEDGFVMDDGVVGRLAGDRFHVTTTTGGAARVLALMEDYLQTEWPELDVWLTSTTEQWAVIAVQGPDARKVIAPLVEGIDVSAAALPHMSVREGHVCGVKARLFRVSFTGELGFEINVPSEHARDVWQAVWEVGKAYDVVAYGTEAMHVLRAEKGYIIVGQEADGTATPDDLGLTWAIGKAKGDFVGKRSLARPAMVRPDRQQLVGLLSLDGRSVLEEGAQLVSDPARATPGSSLGHVTSAYDSAVLGHPIALAMVKGGRARLGTTLHVLTRTGSIAVKLAAPIFFDPDGGRVNA